jgi:hypothetical protein
LSVEEKGSDPGRKGVRPHFLGAVVLAAAALGGCRSLPEVELGPCVEAGYEAVAAKLAFDMPDGVRYRYTLQWRGRTLVANGMSQRTGNGEVNLAGYSDSGITMYKAKWQNNKFRILSNNTGMPDALLEKSVLADVFLLHRRMKAAGQCASRDAKDGGLWLRAGGDMEGAELYFVLADGKSSLMAQKKGRIYYKATVAEKRGNMPSDIRIENYGAGYSARIEIAPERSGE